MILLNAVTGVTEKEWECDKAIKELYFKFSHASALALASVTLTAKIEGRGKIRELMTKCPILYLLEMRALTEGSYKKSATDTRGLVELSGLNAIELGVDEKFTFKLEGLQTGDTITCYGVENALFGNIYNKYTKHIVEAAKEEAVIELPNAKPEERPESIVIENAITSLRIDYMNGRSCEYLSEELAGIAMGANDLTYIDSDNKAYIGNSSIISMGLENIRRITIRKSTAATLTYLLVDSTF